MSNVWAQIPTSKVSSLVLKKLKKGNIIDVGAGPFDYSIQFAVDGFNVTGIEPNEVLYNAGLKKIKSLTMSKENFVKEIEKDVRPYFRTFVLFHKELQEQLNDQFAASKNVEYLNKEIKGKIEFLNYEITPNYPNTDLTKLKEKDSNVFVSAVLQHISDLREFLPYVADMVGNDKYLMILNYGKLNDSFHLVDDILGEKKELKLLDKFKPIEKNAKSIRIEELMEKLGFKLDEVQSIQYGEVEPHKLYFFKKVKNKSINEIVDELNDENIYK